MKNRYVSMNDISIDKDDKIQVMILPSDTFFES